MENKRVTATFVLDGRQYRVLSDKCVQQLDGRHWVTREPDDVPEKMLLAAVANSGLHVCDDPLDTCIEFMWGGVSYQIAVSSSDFAQASFVCRNDADGEIDYHYCSAVDALAAYRNHIQLISNDD